MPPPPDAYIDEHLSGAFDPQDPNHFRMISTPELHSMVQALWHFVVDVKEAARYGRIYPPAVPNAVMKRLKWHLEEAKPWIWGEDRIYWDHFWDPTAWAEAGHPMTGERTKKPKPPEGGGGK